MKINWKIVSALLAAGLAYDTIVEVINRKRHRELLAYAEKGWATSMFYAGKLDEVGAEMTEFDKIIVQNL